MAVLAGTAIAFDIRFGLVIALLPVLAWLLSTPQRRLWTLIFGGILALGSPDLTMAKFGFLTIAIIVLFIVAVRVSTVERDRFDAGILVASAAYMAFLIAISFLAAVAGNEPTDILRDVSTYALLGLVGPVVQDAVPDLKPRAVTIALVVAGILSTVGFTFEWLQRRELVQLQFPEVLISSQLLSAALWSYSISRLYISPRPRTLWVGTAVLTFAFPLLTGTRQILLYLIAPIAIGLLRARERGWGSMWRWLIVVPILGAGMLSTTLLIAGAGAGPIDSEEAINRLATIDDVLEQGLSQDLSWRERVTQNRVAADAVAQAPIAGVGPGYRFTWTRQFPRRIEDSFTMDTSLIVLAKLGIFGTLGLIAVLASWRKVGRLGPAWTLALGGFAAIVLGLSLLAPMPEDKGFAFAMMLLLAGGAARSRPREENQVVLPPTGMRQVMEPPN